MPVIWKCRVICGQVVDSSCNFSSADIQAFPTSHHKMQHKSFLTLHNSKRAMLSVIMPQKLFYYLTNAWQMAFRKVSPLKGIDFIYIGDFLRHEVTFHTPFIVQQAHCISTSIKDINILYHRTFG